MRHELSLGKMVAPLQTRKSKSPKRDRRESKHVARTNIIQNLVGHVIGCDPRQERPFCYSSVTMPDFEPEDSFIIHFNSEMSVAEAYCQVDMETEEVATRLPDIWSPTRQFKDSQPSLPLRRTSIQSQTDSEPDALARDTALTVRDIRSRVPSNTRISLSS